MSWKKCPENVKTIKKSMLAPFNTSIVFEQVKERREQRLKAEARQREQDKIENKKRRKP